MNAILPDPEGNFYVIHPVEIERKGGNQNIRRPGDIEDNSYDYYLFYGTEEIGEVELCLNRNAMNSYYNNLRYLLLTKIKNEELSPLYSLISVRRLKGEKHEIVNQNVNQYYHEGSFNYGIKVHYFDASDFPIEL